MPGEPDQFRLSLTAAPSIVNGVTLAPSRAGVYRMVVTSDFSKAKDWAGWMRGMGRYTRRLRALVGLSQEQLARRAGVSQGAVSRLEAGRAVNAPLVVVMKINAAMREALQKLPPRVLSAESQQIMQVPARGIPSMSAEFDAQRITDEPPLEELVQLYWRVPARLRPRIVEQTRGLVQLLASMEDARPKVGGGSRGKTRARRRS